VGVDVGSGVPPTGAADEPTTGVTPDSFGGVNGTDWTQPTLIASNSTRTVTPEIFLLDSVLGVCVALWGELFTIEVCNFPNKIGPSIIRQYIIWLGIC